MMKITTFLVLGTIFCLLCITHAATIKQKRDLASMKDLIREIKAESNSAQDEDESGDDAIAQLFLKVLEKQAKAERYKDANKSAESEGFSSFFHKIRNFFHRTKSRFVNFGNKVKNFFHRKG